MSFSTSRNTTRPRKDTRLKDLSPCSADTSRKDGSARRQGAASTTTTSSTSQVHQHLEEHPYAWFDARLASAVSPHYRTCGAGSRPPGGRHEIGRRADPSHELQGYMPPPIPRCSSGA